ncbi:hypothetical protein BRADI_1g42562v3 [Brachypodium distachyon]|uniref:Uncharacterized protein n=1 Tax=Brachypodium distachyon TaxID=15368 RepID=I1GYP8_BRADI|nr:hypothetical protein BRADI_1g42562v3 [Brachypodium distachyon]
MAIGVEEIKYFSQAKQQLGRRWRRPARGFRLSPNRVSVRRLRAKLWTMLGLLGRYVRNVRLPLITSSSSSSSPASACAGAGRAAGNKGGHRQQAASAQAPSTGNNNSGKPRRPPCMRSNSFYTRAVAECLDFIKGSNAPVVEDNRGVGAATMTGKKVLKATK